MRSVEKLLEHLKQCQLPTEEEISFLCNKAIEVLIYEDNVVSLTPPIMICGDIHGQFYDLLELFEVGGDVPETNYCFLGDYVDRGRFSLQTFLYLLAIKVKYPTRITLLRGNHESRFTTETYGFYKECLEEFGYYSDVYKSCIQVFDCLPLSALINQDVFAVHGGLSPELKNIDAIRNINRYCEIPKLGVFSDILWSDPTEQIDEFSPSNRGVGFLFGQRALDEFHDLNALTCLLRAHQLCDAGYQYWFNQKLITIWSAPNYCYRCGNAAAILELGERGEKKFNFFYEAPENINRKKDEKELKPLYFL